MPMQIFLGVKEVYYGIVQEENCFVPYANHNVPRGQVIYIFHGYLHEGKSNRFVIS